MNFIIYNGGAHPRLIRPQLPTDDVLFQHCSGGLVGVTPDFFKSTVGPLLRIHKDTRESFMCFQFFAEDGGQVEI